MIDDRSRAASACAPAARLAPPDLDGLIRRHLPMARAVALGYRGKRLPADELAATASLALVEAAHRYDVAEHPEASFARYAERCIRSAILDALCRAPIVRMGRDRERAVLKAGRGGWEPYGVAVEELVLMAPGPEGGVDPEELAAAVAACDPEGRALVGLLFEGRTVPEAARSLGITPARARAAYRGAVRSLRASLIERN